MPSKNILNSYATDLKQNIADNGLLGEMRNELINGDFDIWQRGTSQTSSGYGSADRWSCAHFGSTKTHSQQAFAIGQTEVPGNPMYFSRTVVTSVSNAANYVLMNQNIEGVRTLSGKVATVTFYAKADAAKNIAIEIQQYFGTGGSPSATVTGIGSQLIPLTTTWQKFTRKITIPSITGKTIGTNANDYISLLFWFDAGSNANARTANLGQQSGTFDIAHVSMVEGDATGEADPFYGRHFQQELALCQRYYEKSFSLNQAPAQNIGISGAVTIIMAHTSLLYDTTIYFGIQKRISSPTITTYSPNAANSNWSTNSGAPTASLVNYNDRCFSLRANGGTAGGSYTIHWTADAEL